VASRSDVRAPRFASWIIAIVANIFCLSNGIAAPEHVLPRCFKPAINPHIAVTGSVQPANGSSSSTRSGFHQRLLSRVRRASRV